MKIITLLFLLTFLFSCEEKECCQFMTEENAQISGSWLLYEHGYSPGAGYITEPVAPLPAQVLALKPDGKVASDVPAFKEFTFYAVIADEHQQEVLVLFKEKPSS